MIEWVIILHGTFLDVNAILSELEKAKSAETFFVCFNVERDIQYFFLFINHNTRQAEISL